MNIRIRPLQPHDISILKAITIDSFEGVSLEHNLHQQFGELNQHDWRWRKERHIDADVAAHPDGVFVAVKRRHDAQSDAQGDVQDDEAEQIVGFITTRLDRESGQGWIPNLAVVAEMRGQQLGRRLIEHALAYFRSEGLAYAVIETMAQNEIGQHLYPSCGFVEVARQVHYAQKL